MWQCGGGGVVDVAQDDDDVALVAKLFSFSELSSSEDEGILQQEIQIIIGWFENNSIFSKKIVMFYINTCEI